MTFETWDIERFPLTAEAARQTPGQRDADKFLREVQPGDLDRLTREHENDPADKFFGVPTGGGGLAGGGGMHYGPEGYNQPERSYPHPLEEPEEREEHGGYYMPGINAPWDDDDEMEHEPAEYHVVTGPVGSNDHREWTEHQYTRFEPVDSDYDPEGAWDYFQQDHPEYNPERNVEATHEVKHVHPTINHDLWHNQLTGESQAFERIAEHGFSRESPDIPEHKAYIHTDPNGGVHRLWHNHTHFSVEGGGEYGPGWRTSYWTPSAVRHEQLPWSFHDDNGSSDSLGDALKRVDLNKHHSDIAHSGTGLRTVENSYGRHYVSQRSDGSTQQMLRNFGHTDEPNWGVVHYPMNGSPHTFTEHGSDLQGALAQAKANLARG